MSDDNTYTVLNRIEGPADLKKLAPEQRKLLAAEVRRAIISRVTQTGGHLAPSLGVVELTIALHTVFDTPKDKIIWDVGHQAYAHKILTGRRDQFHTLRQYQGLSGFPRRAESPHDAFDTGHASTSISAALGMAIAKRLNHDDGKVIAVIGDGSMTAGLAYEGLNQAGDLDEDLIVVFNDNGMSIAPNVGAISKFMQRALSGKAYQNLRKELERLLPSVPAIGEDLLELAKRSEESFKAFITPGILFEAFKFNYIGPLDGHDLERLTSAFKTISRLKGPILVHVLTKKGKGFPAAEHNPTHFHGVGSLMPKLGHETQGPPSYTSVFGRTLIQQAKKNPKVMAITAAMPEGTGMQDFSEQIPERFMDVGIAEQHAVTCAAGLACEGFRPVVAIYSTFMQRAFDQVVHDVCLMNLPVVLAMDRGGIVGEDGATHQGLLDLSFMRCVPNLAIMVPADENELRHMLVTALEHDGPVALRYPRGKGLGVPQAGEAGALPWGKSELRREGSDLLIAAVGVGVAAAQEAAGRLEKRGVSAAVLNARFVKPLDEDAICELAAKFGRVVTVEENVAAGGFGSAVLECLSRRGLHSVKTMLVAVGDTFVEHGSQAILRHKYAVDADAVEEAALSLME